MKPIIPATTAVTRGNLDHRVIGRRLRLWLDLWSERRMLRALDARALADLGLSRADVEREAARSPWDAPSSRLW